MHWVWLKLIYSYFTHHFIISIPSYQKNYKVVKLYFPQSLILLGEFLVTTNISYYEQCAYILRFKHDVVTSSFFIGQHSCILDMSSDFFYKVDNSI